MGLGHEDAFAILDGYGIDINRVKPEWVDLRMSQYVVPYAERLARTSFSGVQEIDEIHDGSGDSILMLDRRPIVELVSIERIGSADFVTGVDISNIEVISERGMLKARQSSGFSCTFERGDDNIKVKYKYGYKDVLDSATVDTPADIKEAIVSLTARDIINFFSARTGGGQSVNQTGYSRTFGELGKWHDIKKELLWRALNILQPLGSSVVGD